jgi:hypothetical protein
MALSMILIPRWHTEAKKIEETGAIPSGPQEAKSAIQTLKVGGSSSMIED